MKLLLSAQQVKFNCWKINSNIKSEFCLILIFYLTKKKGRKKRKSITLKWNMMWKKPKGLIREIIFILKITNKRERPYLHFQLNKFKNLIMFDSKYLCFILYDDDNVCLSMLFIYLKENIKHLSIFIICLIYCIFLSYICWTYKKSYLFL